MGVILRLVMFLVGALGLIFVGLNAASGFNVDTGGLLMKLGEAPGGVATSMAAQFNAGLDELGQMIAKAQGAAADPEKPSLLVSYGPEVIAAVVSGLLMMFSMRR